MAEGVARSVESAAMAARSEVLAEIGGELTEQGLQALAKA